MINSELDKLKTLKITDLKPEHLPFAYALIGIGMLVIVKSPTKLMSLIGGFLFYRNLVEQGKERLKSEIAKHQSH